MAAFRHKSMGPSLLLDARKAERQSSIMTQGPSMAQAKNGSFSPLSVAESGSLGAASAPSIAPHVFFAECWMLPVQVQ